jgi:hypothetical protein
VRIRRRGTEGTAAAGPPSTGDASVVARHHAAEAELPADSRAWNLWELERLAGDLNGDALADERRLLLLHLREFADASGHLPVRFDSLIRDAFGEHLIELVT